MKYKPERDLPDFARELKSVSPTKLAEMVLSRRNREITAESITMWFKRHPDVQDALSKELVGGLPTEKQSVDLSIFENGNFQELPSVKKWKEFLYARELTEDFIRSKIITLRNLCRGTLHGHDLVAEGKWCLKHPDRLVFNDLLEMNATLKDMGIDTYSYKRDMKDFLENVRDIPVGKKITVGRPQSFGKYAKLNCSMDTIRLILEGVKAENAEAYAVDLFMLKTATRITATLKANIEDFIVLPNSNAMITVFDKGRRSKYPKGHPWDKHIDYELLRILEPYIKERKTGRLFRITEDTMSDLNGRMIR